MPKSGEDCGVRVCRFTNDMYMMCNYLFIKLDINNKFIFISKSTEFINSMEMILQELENI